MEKGIITVVGEDPGWGYYCESMYIFSRKQVKYLRYLRKQLFKDTLI